MAGQVAQRQVRLHELAFACRIYGTLTGYDSSLAKLRRTTGQNLDPRDPVDQEYLFGWQNHWGCRQFSTAHHASVAAPSLTAWADEWLMRLPPASTTLETIDPAQIDLIGHAYGDLRARQAGTRTRRNGLISHVEYGPVGAAKTLFALRPNLCPPWDDYTQSRLGFDRSAASYARYPHHVRTQLQAVAAQAGVAIAQLPALVSRPESTPPKLIDEYHWVTITRNFTPPTHDELAQWLSLGRTLTRQRRARPGSKRSPQRKHTARDYSMSRPLRPVLRAVGEADTRGSPSAHLPPDVAVPRRVSA